MCSDQLNSRYLLDRSANAIMLLMAAFIGNKCQFAWTKHNCFCFGCQSGNLVYLVWWVVSDRSLLDAFVAMGGNRSAKFTGNNLYVRMSSTEIYTHRFGYSVVLDHWHSEQLPECLDQNIVNYQLFDCIPSK